MADSIDYRFSSDICQELDLLEREDWKQFAVSNCRQVLESLKEITKQKNARHRDRDSTEDMIAIQRHQQALSGWGVEPQNEKEKELTRVWMMHLQQF